jgi:hypothetical protein
MTAKKRPQTKREENKRYLARKKTKKEAAIFEAALEIPSSSHAIPVADVEMDQASQEEIHENMADEDWNPHAPEGVITMGEEFEAPAQEPGPDFPEEEPKAEDGLGAATEGLEELAPHSGHSLPEDTVERLEHAVDAIRWLSQQNRRLPDRAKKILSLRIERIEELIPLL